MFEIPRSLNWLAETDEARTWLQDLPSHVAACVKHWSLELNEPYCDSHVSIVFPVNINHRSPAVLKIQFPHPESVHEADALRCWNGNGAVRLLDENVEHHALLIERCEPGDHLSTIAPEAALDVFAELLPRLWVDAGEPFVSAGDEAARWAKELPSTWDHAGQPFELDLLDAAIQAIETLVATTGRQVLVHQDLHGDNVLRAAREPWLVIDPKPLVGEREFSLAPIIRSYEFGHSRECVLQRLDTLTSALRLDRERARFWAMAQTLAWAFEGDRVLDGHVETARWLWRA